MMTNVDESSFPEATPVDQTADNEDAVATLESGLNWAITELHEKTEELRQLRRERQVVQELTAGLLTLTCEEDLAQRLLSDLRMLVHADNGSVMLADEDGDKMEIVADMGLPDEARELKVPMFVGKSSCSVRRKDKVYICSDLGQFAIAAPGLPIAAPGLLFSSRAR